ncbi:hypothetical protein [Patulibacter sp.]|uniref:hypothetical protein n=1 Tax=Patulibacter sp. TaxID=1912859 RepID=UPI002718EC5A|nr:hypothetical protein [Patulibacter sp.]MDO9409187.1 hypothetical protein [Patulibacter sp.]
MSAPSPAPVAFGLTLPLRAGLGRLVRRPLATLLPVLLLLLPVVPVALAVAGVLRAGADVALTELIAGAPADAPGAVIVRPDGFEVRLLIALAALLTVGVALVVAAGLVTGAATAGSRGAGDAVRRAWRAWPGVALVIVLSALAVALVAAGVVAVAVLAGRVRFQLTSVLLTVGLGATAVVVLRLSLWPAVALRDGVGLRRALGASWTATRGSVVRLVLAAVVVVVALALPTGLAWLAITAVLDALADAEVLELSPVAIGLWALVLLPPAVLVGVVVWGVGGRAVLVALGAAPGAQPPTARSTERRETRSKSRAARA